MYDPDNFIPAKPSNITIRELMHGIKLKQPAQLIPLGAATNLVNLQTSSGGLRRADCWVQQAFDVANAVAGDFIQEVQLVFTTQSELDLLFFGESRIYKLSDDLSEIQQITWGMTIGTGASPVGTVAQADGRWSVVINQEFDISSLSIGDLVKIDTGLFRILDLMGQTLYIDASETQPTTGDKNQFAFVYQLQNRAPFPKQHIALPGNVFFVDRSERKLLAYNLNSGMRELSFDSTKNVSQINAVAYHDYRLWLGGMSIDGQRCPNRLLWGKRSSPLDSGFLEIEDPSFYLDLIGPKTEILRILSLGSLLVVYFFDAIFFGRPTNIVGLPYDFEQLNTGGLGLVGANAVCSLADGHYFVGRDDIYFFSAQGSLEKIGSEILKETVENPEYRDNLDQTRVVADPKNSRILFMFYAEGEISFDEIWAYNYEFKSWYRLDINGRSLSQFSLVTSETWNTITPGYTTDVPGNPGVPGAFTWPAFMTDSWASFKPGGNFNQLFLIQADHLFLPADDQQLLCEARDGLAPEVVFESGDIDMDSPDMNKTVTRLSLKVDRPMGQAELLEFNVEVSSNRGQTWKPCGILRISAGRDESKVNFRLTGSLIRFRLTSTSEVRRYRITEISLRARIGGLETQYR